MLVVTAVAVSQVTRVGWLTYTGSTVPTFRATFSATQMLTFRWLCDPTYRGALFLEDIP
jgi:hypothetical protein